MIVDKTDDYIYNCCMKIKYEMLLCKIKDSLFIVFINIDGNHTICGN